MYNKEIKMAEDVVKEAFVNDHAYLTGKEFSIFMQNLLVQDGHYVIDVGNWEDVNLACARILLRQIKKHPFIWKHFFIT